MQRHRLLINKSFSATTAAINSGLQNVNNYISNNIQGLGGGTVNASNVRGFLNDEANENLVDDFFSYLTGSTTVIEFAEIYNSDQKLADNFNNYYESVVVNNLPPSTSVLDASLSGTNGITVVNNQYFNYSTGFAPEKGLSGITQSINSDTRLLEVYSALTTFTTDESYYLPIFLTRNYSPMERHKVEFDNIISNYTATTEDNGGDTGPIVITNPPVGQEAEDNQNG